MTESIPLDEQKIIVEFMDFFNRSDKEIYKDKRKPPKLYADAAKDIPITDYRDAVQEYIKAGQTVRIIGSSRWGYFEVTRNLDKPRRAELLVLGNSGELKNFRATKKTKKTPEVIPAD